MGRLEELRINAYLSEVARGYSNNAFVAQHLFPEITSEKEKIDIFEFNKEAFNLYDTERAIRANSNVISPQGLKKHTTILYSSTLIDGYLRGRYTLPLDAHFPLLRILAIDLSIHRLYSRRMRDEMPEVIENNYKNAISTLKDIQKGVISLQSENDSLETAGFNAEEYKTNIWQYGINFTLTTTNIQDLEI